MITWFKRGGTTGYVLVLCRGGFFLCSFAEKTTQLLIVIYAPAGSDRAMIQRYALIAAQRMMEFNGGQVSDIDASSVQESL